jgi:hypothetical protein
MASSPSDLEKVRLETLRFFRETVEWLAHYHREFGLKSKHDLEAEDQVNAAWKLSGTCIAQATALVDLLERGYSAQVWPNLRALHEANRLLVAVADPDEPELYKRWLRDKQVKQTEAREAEQRGSDRLAAQLREAGIDAPDIDVTQYTGVIYRGMSKAAHHQRSIVDESVDARERTMVYGPDPSPRRRFAYAAAGGTVIHEVLLLVGDALSRMWGPRFYEETLTPMLRRFEEALEALDVIETAHSMGWDPDTGASDATKRVGPTQ